MQKHGPVVHFTTLPVGLGSSKRKIADISGRLARVRDIQTIPQRHQLLSLTLMRPAAQLRLCVVWKGWKNPQRQSSSRRTDSHLQQYSMEHHMTCQADFRPAIGLEMHQWLPIAYHYLLHTVLMVLYNSMNIYRVIPGKTWKILISQIST